MDQYTDRKEAGLILAKSLKQYENKSDILILALPRGGVPVAYEIATRLNLPLDLCIVRKLGVPWHQELAMGALGYDGTVFLDKTLIAEFGISEAEVEKVIFAEKMELKRRLEKYRGDKPLPVVKNKMVIVVDDGIATGASMRVALKTLRKQGPKKLVLAIPVMAASTYAEMKHLVDELVCPLVPAHFYAVGQWYQTFTQTTDEEVLALMDEAKVRLQEHVQSSLS